MAQIYRTTLTPSKLDLAAGWLAGRAWYRGSGAPDLVKAGGFRLDDPDGEVGCEFMVVRDADGTCYQLPVTYRGAPVDGADEALVGTTEHGVLGRRWVYDGADDPLLLTVLAGFLNGEVPAQAQSESDTLDPTVLAVLSGGPAVPADLDIVRVLVAGELPAGRGHVSGTWHDGTTTVRGPMVLVR
ncbi:maltokinase N-terminal cap-like domain-containing protein [Nakamurella deserti]|uniref:maltokinase N-terminal cap-like domain-containing protein n=1 Tax=Nakamurella deserti TaxID=2164074 RepID=UPI000DBE7C06|nr:1,4-alpha-glucan branching protein [Nakamurella deserti]